MDILHLCRLCLKTSGYHFNIFTEVISNKHLYQFINNICELGVFRNDGYPEHICENCFQSIGNIICFKTQAKETEAALTRMKKFRNITFTEQKEKEEVKENVEALDTAFDHSTVNQLFIKTEIDTDEIAIPAEQVEIEKITEMEESISWKHLNEMESIPAMLEKSESQEILTRQKFKQEIEDNEEAMDPVFDHSTINQEEVSAISLDVNASPDEDKSLFQEKVVSAISLDENASCDEDKSISKEFSEVRRGMECHHCGEKRETKQEIAQHIVDVHSSFSNKDNTPIQEQRQDKKYTCSMCELRFKEKSYLARHMRKHTGEKPFRCNVCNFSCSNSGYIKRHMRMHTGEKPFKCNICNYRCSQNGRLKVHMRMHTGEKPFKCNLCNYRCAQSGHLRRHIRMHIGKKPFQCNICNYSSSRSGEIKRHMQKHTG